MEENEDFAWHSKFLVGDELTTIIYVQEKKEEGLITQYSTFEAPRVYKALLENTSVLTLKMAKQQEIIDAMLGVTN